MKQIISLKNQTVFDIAKQHYGDIAMFDKVMELNSDLKNDYSAATSSGFDFDYLVFDLAFPLKEGTKLLIDTKLVLPAIIRELNNIEIITFSHKDLE